MKDKLTITFENKVNYSFSFNNSNNSYNIKPSINPPNNLKPNEVPMFVHIGFDDNMISGYEGSDSEGGVSWILDLFDSLTNNQGINNPQTYDGSKCFTSFFCSSQYIKEFKKELISSNKRAWFNARMKGHEICNHTHTHNSFADIAQMKPDQWKNEINKCNTELQKPFLIINKSLETTDTGININKGEVFGFRAPFLEYNNNLFDVLKELSFTYDSSLIEGMQTSQNGENMFWPYTINNIPTNNPFIKLEKENLKNFSGLWEMPIYSLIIPNDELSDKYYFKKGLRNKIKKLSKSDMKSPYTKVMGLDYNLMVEYKLTKSDVLAIMKYNFDLKYNSNRSPFIFVAHSENYATNTPSWKTENLTVKEKQEVIEEFLKYTLTKEDTRVVSLKQIEEWMKTPTSLKSKRYNENQVEIPIDYNGDIIINIYDMCNKNILSIKSNTNTKDIRLTNKLETGSYLLEITGVIEHIGKIFIQ